MKQGIWKLQSSLQVPIDKKFVHTCADKLYLQNEQFSWLADKIYDNVIRPTKSSCNLSKWNIINK